MGILLLSMPAPRPSRATTALLALLLMSGCGQKKTETAAAAGRGGGGQKQPVEVVVIERRDLADMLTLVGSLAANEAADLRPEIAGQVRTVMFEEGEHVAKGQVLVKIDDAELRAQVAQAESAFRLAELNLQRSENLGGNNTISQAEVDRTRSEHSSAQAALSLLRVRLDKTEIKAPFDGVVGARAVSPGDYVTAQTVITTLNDLSRLKVDFQVPERFAAKVKPGTVFSLRSPGLPADRTAAGEVYFASAVIDRATRSTQVKGYVTDPPATLKPGMFTNVDLTLEVRRNVLTVPEGAILTTAGGASVIAVKTDRGDAVAEFVAVRLGLRSRGLVEVVPLKGEFAERQIVVASGVGGLNIFPGTRLEPRPLKPEFRVAD